MSQSLLTGNGRVGGSSTNDWYSLTVTQNETVNLDLSALFGNPEISLYNTSSTQAVAFAYASQTGDGWVNEVLQPGTYYVDVSASSDSQYTLTVSSGTPSVAGGANGIGNTLATAISIGTLAATPELFAGGLTSGSESAFYSFNVSGNSSVKIQLLGVTAGGLVYLRNASGQQLAVTAYSPTSDASLIDTLGSLNAGTYYIDVEGYQTTSTGYDLSVQATPLTANAGTSLGNARSIGALGSATQIFSDSLNALTTQEYYSFTVSSASHLNAEVSGLAAGATLTLEDSAGNRITSANGSATSSASLLTNLASLAAGTYYLEVSTSGTSTTPYTLSVNAAPITNNAGTSFATATSIGTLGTASIQLSDFVGAVDPADYDRFVVTSPTTVNLTLSAYAGDDPSSASLTLFNSANTAIVSAVAANSQSNALINTVLQPGTYTAEVTTNAVSAPYSLTLSTVAPTVGTPSTQTAGSSIANAPNLGTLSANGTIVAGYVGPNTNVYDEITLATPSLLNLQATGLASSNILNLSLLDLAGNTLQIDGSSNTAFQGASLLDQVAAGSYYIEVSDAGAGTGYSLAASATPLPATAGGSTASAKNIGNLGSLASFSGFVGAVETDNFYEFILSAASVATLDLSSAASQLTLDDVSGKSLAHQTASGGSSDGILVQPLAAGTYYLDVQDVGGSPADYTLNLNATPIIDPAGSTQGTAYALGTLANGGSGGTTQASTLTGGGSNTIDAGSGSTTITAPSGYYVTTEGNNTIYLSGGSSTVSATTGNPLIFGQSSALTFVGGSGVATVIGGSAGNTVTGGSGSLLMFAGSSATYNTGSGAATIIGGTGTLTASLGAGGGILFGSSGGVNNLSASGGTAALVAGGSGDILTASGAGNDILVGVSGAETLNAANSTGNDAFFGGSGAESINGGAGNDYFVVGSGNETLTGNGGINAYIFAAGSAPRTDIITDFGASASNFFGLFNYGANANAAAFASAVVSGGNTIITLPDGTNIILQGVTNLTASRFL